MTDAMIDWSLQPWSHNVDATFTFYHDTADTEPWLVVTKHFLSTDQAVPDETVRQTVRDALQQVLLAMPAWEALGGLLASIADVWQLARPDDPGLALWWCLSMTAATGAAGYRVTLRYARDDAGNDVWFEESKVFSITDAGFTADGMMQTIMDRVSYVARAYDRAAQLAASLGIVVGERFPVENEGT